MTFTTTTASDELSTSSLGHRERPVPVDGSSLACLLDRFTRSVTNTASDTVGEFSATIEALHGELNMLAHHFTARAKVQEMDELDFDDIFPGETNIPAELDPAYHGIMSSEELEHQCWKISR